MDAIEVPLKAIVSVWNSNGGFGHLEAADRASK
jgi:hypothetical protein